MKPYTLYAIRYTLILAISFCLIGCDAFVRKFTRKPKRDEMPREEMVLEPQEYKSTMTKEQQYRQYLVFWKSWQDELIKALLENTSHKKQVDCANEAIKNLASLKALLKENKQKQLDVYLKQMNELKDAIHKDTYGSNHNYHRLQAERIRRNILQYFSFGDIKKDLA